MFTIAIWFSFFFIFSGHLEKYLEFMDKSFEFEEEIKQVNYMCELEFEGSQLYKSIQILRIGARYLDSDGSCMIRLEDDGPSETQSPHLVAVRIDT